MDMRRSRRRRIRSSSHSFEAAASWVGPATRAQDPRVLGRVSKGWSPKAWCSEAARANRWLRPRLPPFPLHIQLDGDSVDAPFAVSPFHEAISWTCAHKKWHRGHALLTWPSVPSDETVVSS